MNPEKEELYTNLKIAVPIAQEAYNRLNNIKLNILDEDKRDRYLDILNEYGEILLEIRTYVEKQIPLYDKLIYRLKNGNPENCEIIYKNLNYPFVSEISKRIICLKRNVNSLLYDLKGKIQEKKWMGLFSIFSAIIIAIVGIITGIFTLGIGSAFTILAISAAGIGILSGIGFIVKAVENFFEYDDMKKIEESLKIIDDKLRELEKGFSNLNISLEEFKLEIEMKDENLKESAEKVKCDLEMIREILLEKPKDTNIIKAFFKVLIM